MEITHYESSRTLLGQEDPRNSNMVSSLERLNSEIYKPKLYHPILDISRDLNPSKAAMTVGIKIRLVTGTYFLQEVRAKYTCVSPL